MKRNNIIYIFILSILMLSIRNTYAATSIVSFKNSSGGHIVSMTMTYQLDKKEYSPGETIYPTVYYGLGHIACSNGANIDRPLFSRPLLEIGNPDKTKPLEFWTVSKPNSTLYFNTADKIIYQNDAMLLNTNSLIEDADGNPIQTNSITNTSMFFDGSGYIRANYKKVCNDQFYCIEDVISGRLWYNSNLDNGVYKQIEIFTPTIVKTYIANFGEEKQYPIKSSSYYFGKQGLPSSIFIPNNATPGEYISLLTIYPSWTSTINPVYPTTGSWNIYQTNINSKTNKIVTNFSTILTNIFNFNIQKANALMPVVEFEVGDGGGSGGNGYTPPPPSCVGWWCDVDFFSVPFSEPFIIKSNSAEINIKLK